MDHVWAGDHPASRLQIRFGREHNVSDADGHVTDDGRV